MLLTIILFLLWINTLFCSFFFYKHLLVKNLHTILFYIYVFLMHLFHIINAYQLNYDIFLMYQTFYHFLVILFTTSIAAFFLKIYLMW